MGLRKRESCKKDVQETSRWRQKDLKPGKWGNEIWKYGDMEMEQ